MPPPFAVQGEVPYDGDRAALRGVRGQEGEEDAHLRHLRKGGRRVGIQQECNEVVYNRVIHTAMPSYLGWVYFF